MDERDQKAESTAPADEEEIVRRLLEGAGSRPPIAQEDLDAISAAARSAWQMQVRRRARASAHRTVWARAAGLAAVLTVTVGLAWWWTSRRERRSPTVAWIEAVAGCLYLEGVEFQPRPLTKGEPIPRGAALRSRAEGGQAAGRASLRLLDRTIVRLDVGTRLRLVAAATLELERGAIYVDTGSGARTAAALEVRTPLGTARDIGTQFAVRISDSEGPSLTVRVRHGAVAVERLSRTYVTPAGQELVLHPDGSSQRRQMPSYGPEWEWVMESGAGFDLEGRTVQEFLDWVARETGWQIRFADDRLADSARKIVLHGGMGKLRPDRAPFAILPGAGLEGELRSGILIVGTTR